VEHRGEQGVGHPVPRDVDERNAAGAPASLEILNDIQATGCARAIDAGRQVESLFEIDVRDVVAAHRTRERERATPHVESPNRRHLARQGHELLRDLLKVLELARQASKLVGAGF